MVMMSSGRMLSPDTMFSAAASRACTSIGRSSSAIAFIAPSTAQPPSLSYFMPFMPLFTLRL